MKLTAIQVNNFLGAHSINVQLQKPVSMFAGLNYAGKSSLQEAIRMALIGESVRVGLKKDFAELVTNGADDGFAEVHTADGAYSVVLPSGKGNHSESEALPYVLDAQRFANLETNERRSFLFGLMGLKTDGAAVKARLTARGFDAAKIEAVMPLLRAGFDAAHKEAQAKARDAKASWRTTTGETYGSQKAEGWTATFVSEAPSHVITQESLNKLDADIEAASGTLGGLQARARDAELASQKLANLRDKAGRYARIQDKLNLDTKDRDEWQTKVDRIKAAQHSQDALPCPLCGTMLVHQHDDLLGKLVEAGPMANGTEDEIGKLPEYEKALALLVSAVRNGERDLAEANAAAEALKQLEEGEQPPTPEEIEAAKANLNTLKDARRTAAADLDQVKSAQRKTEEAEAKTKAAAKYHGEVKAWELIADALAPDGIPGEMLAEALSPINDRLFATVDSTEWGQVAIHSDMRITYALRDYALLSESEKWRCDAMIAEAVSHLSGTRLLVLDRFDVLDLKGREDLLYWLDGLAEDNEIDTAIVFGTLKGLPAQLPEMVEAFWIEGGATGHMREAA